MHDMELPISNVQLPNKTQIPNPKLQYREHSKVYDIRERLLIFGKRILEICKKLPRLPECEKIRGQLGGAGTSIGANFEEADCALTKKDFVNKVGIARKEANETRYWLKVTSGIYIDENEISRDIRESEEIINILSSILKKSGIAKRI